jgi:hypothetical protein
VGIENAGGRLTDPEGGPAPPLSLDASVIEALDSLLSFDGHNGFYGAGGKDYAVRGLRAMVNSGIDRVPTRLRGTPSHLERRITREQGICANSMRGC